MGDNISESQIMLQLKRLNEDFRKKNTDTLLSSHPYYPIQADCEIEFCLARRDPSGAATSGIVRYNKKQASWTRTAIDSFIKPSTIWNRYNYINIWCVDIDDPSGVDGYATFPASTSDTTDGLVVATSSFGSIGRHKSITATHELGHFLNLRHVWGDDIPFCGDDLVADTPPSSSPNTGCPAFPHNPFDSCGTNETGDIFMNYMDYSDAECTVMFTTGQKDRMLATLAGIRSSLTSSDGCAAPLGISESIVSNKYDIYPNPNNGSFTINGNNKKAPVNIVVYNGFGVAVLKMNAVQSFPQNIDMSTYSSGLYFLKMNFENGSLTQKIIIAK